MSEFDDKPIDSPEEDKFGFKALAKAIADSISKMKSPEGTVIAINGPWGSGKSSLINLVRHHLEQIEKERSLKDCRFQMLVVPWTRSPYDCIFSGNSAPQWSQAGKPREKLFLKLGHNSCARQARWQVQ